MAGLGNRGSEAELRRLGEAWQHTVGGRGEAICLIGEPDIGKSRAPQGGTCGVLPRGDSPVSSGFEGQIWVRYRERRLEVAIQFPRLPKVFLIAASMIGLF